MSTSTHQIRRIHHEKSVEGVGNFVQDKSYLKKRRLQGASDPQGHRWANDTSSVGFQLLESMGWEKGKGLGSQQEGRTDIISTKVKTNNGGLGTSESEAALGQMRWSESNDAFSNALSSLNKVYGKKSSSKKHDSKSKKKSREKSKKKKEKSRKRDRRESDTSSDSDSDSSSSSSSKEKVVHISSHVSYSRRLASKSVSHYSQERLSEIMGESISTSAPSPAKQQSKSTDESDYQGVIISIPTQPSSSSQSIRDIYRRALDNTFVRGSTQGFLLDL